MREEAIIKNQDRILATAAKVLKKQHLILYIFNKDSSPEVYGYGFSENELKDSSQFFHLIKHTQESRSPLTQITDQNLLRMNSLSFQFGFFGGIQIKDQSDQLIGIFAIFGNENREFNQDEAQDFEFFAEQLTILYVHKEVVHDLKDKEFQLLNQFIESDDLYNNSPIGYSAIDIHGKIVKSNITFLDWLGITKKKILSLSLIDNFLADESIPIMKSFIEKIFSGINLNDIEIEIKGKNNSRRTCLVSGRKYFDKEPFARLSFFDITEKAIIKDLLDQEMQKLIEKNDILNRDLEMAAKIQARLLPSHNQYSFINYMYNPLEQIGGDFCDIFPIGDSIGIFISDVAGHGVPSAFVTAMLKSGMENASQELKADPGMLLSYLNESIIDFCAGRFVTAFYGVYNPESRQLRYSLAGHPSPYCLKDGAICNLNSSKSSRPLGILSSTSKILKYKPYVNQEEIMEKGTRLLLYTDGLLEAAIFKDNKKIFYEEYIPEQLLTIANLPIESFLKAVMDKLEQFVQNEPLEDDICMIVFDIV